MVKVWSEEKTKYNFVTFVLVFIFIVIATIAIIKTINQAGSISDPASGEVTYSDSLTDAEKTKLISILKDSKLKADVTISAETTSARPLANNEIIFDVYVPVTNFYNSRLALSADEWTALQQKYIKTVNAGENGETINFHTAEIAAVYGQTIAAGEPGMDDSYTIVPLSELTPEMRMLSVDGRFYLDNDEDCALYRVLHFDSSDPADAKEKVPAYSYSTPDNTLSFAQTGVTALARNMTNTLNGQAGGDGSWFAANIKDYLSKFDLTHISNESSFVDGCEGSTGTMQLCSDWRAFDSIVAIGTDIVELTGNHNNNYGTEANIASINRYHELNMSTFGGGVNEEEAKKPLRITSEKSSAESTEVYNERQNEKPGNITLIGFNDSTSSVASGDIAHGDTPGANGYDEETVKTQIEEAKARGDFVIVDIQYFECQCYPDGWVEYRECDAPIDGQTEFFRSMIDLGADMVIGTQAHQAQTFELYHGKPIYYGLGNLFFDQTYWKDTETGYILTHYFINGKYVQTRIAPTIYDEKHQVKLMDKIDAENFVKRLMEAKPNEN